MTFIPSQDCGTRLPLGSLDAVFLDTETTGLDPVRDHIIEFGAVRMVSGAVDDSDAFAAFVNPGKPIPAASSLIHGISDGDVSGAPGFPEAMAAFSAWVGPSLVIGFSVGFDLAVLKAEHRRHGLTWNAPRTVDVQDLVMALAPDLPNWSLETVAAWLGVEVGERHRAKADAVLSARVFAGLVPELRLHGITTFSEAERAARQTRKRAGESVADGAAGTATFTPVDSFPYRHRVRDIMRTPPQTVDPDAVLSRALALMADRGSGSVLVSPRTDGIWGILTERDILLAIHADGPKALGKRVTEYCSRPLVSVAPKEFVYRAQVAMSAKGIRHIGVAEEDGKIMGVLSIRDTVSHHAGGAALGREIDEADSPAALGRVWGRLSTVADSLVMESVDARAVSAIISRELRAMTQRCCELAEQELSDAGEPAPVPFAMIVLGSGGRGESLLAMDQDNAIVFRDGQPGGSADNWCGKFGQRVADMLDAAGVKYCTGGVMASKPEWRMELAGWMARTEDWLARTSPEDLLSSDIFFDAMPVHGDMRLADGLRRSAIERAGDAKPFLSRLALKAADFRSPFGWLNRLRLDHGRIDLKMHGLLPIVSAARVAALKHGIDSRSTAERLRAVRELGVVPKEATDLLIAAHGVLLDAILRQQLEDLRSGVALSNSVGPENMDAPRRQQLKWALEQVPQVANLLGVPVTV